MFLYLSSCFSIATFHLENRKLIINRGMTTVKAILVSTKKNKENDSINKHPTLKAGYFLNLSLISGVFFDQTLL